MRNKSINALVLKELNYMSFRARTYRQVHKTFEPSAKVLIWS